MKRKILSVLLCVTMALTAGCSAVAAKQNIPADSEVTNKTAQDIAGEMGLGLNLGNTMEAYWLSENRSTTGASTIGENKPSNYETCWGAIVTTREAINGMKEAGFKTVRIPVYWGNMMEDDGSYTINSEYMARVKEIVDYCHDADLYTVINIHHYDEFIIRRNSLEDCEKIFTNLWTQIAEEFRDYDEKLVFEGYNEYLGGGPIDENGNVTDRSDEEAYKWTNTLNQTFVDAVRKTGGNNSQRVLIVSGYWTNIDKTTAEDFVMPTDTAENKLMVSVHYVDNAMYWMNRVGGEEWLNYIDSQCELLKTAFTDKGIPVFMGESTAIYPESNFASNAKHTDSTECLEIVLRKLIDYGFVPVIWDVNNNFYSRTEYKIKSDSDRELIETLSKELES